MSTSSPIPALKRTPNPNPKRSLNLLSAAMDHRSLKHLRSNLSLQIQIPTLLDVHEEEEEGGGGGEEEGNSNCYYDYDDDKDNVGHQLLLDDIYSSDEFRMYEFKVRMCGRARSHDWTDCPWAHPGEKARRRDPRKHPYSAAICPDYKSRGGSCPRGDNCGFAHGVFERWLHPAKYRTTPCRDGTGCRRKVCFFAHTRKQLRTVVSEQLFLSPTSTLAGFGCFSPMLDSPPLSASAGKRGRRKGRGVGEVIGRLEAMEINGPDVEWVEELLELE